MNSRDDSELMATAWEEFCDTLRSAGAVVLRQNTPGSTGTRGDGFAHLAQLLSLGLDFFLLNSDPDRPEFSRLITATRKWALDNPDSLYDRAPVSSNNNYRITGQLGTAALMLFDINTGMVGSRARPRRQGAHLTSHDLEIGEDGAFEITVSADEYNGNWLALDPEVSPFDFGLVVRQYFASADNEAPASFAIERLGEATQGGPRSAAQVARGFQEAANFVLDTVEYWASMRADLEVAPNQLLPQRGSRFDGGGANPDNAYFWGLWRLEPGQALVIRCNPAPEAEFWNFYVSNIWWEDLDARSHRMKVNSSDARLEADGSLQIVLASHDPGFGNFVQTTGYTEGIMLLRMTFPRSMPAVDCRIMNTATAQ